MEFINEHNSSYFAPVVSFFLTALFAGSFDTSIHIGRPYENGEEIGKDDCRKVLHSVDGRFPHEQAHYRRRGDIAIETNAE